MPKKKKLQPAQHQRQQPGREHKMKPQPQAEDEKHRGSGKLQDRVAIITGGDSGIGRAVAIAVSKEGAHISVTASTGSAHLLDYSTTKGAITSFTRSLSHALADKCIRVNGVAPGPVWPPLIPSTFPAKEVETFGSDVPLGRAGQPEEIAPSYVFLASDDSSYMTGQILHPNGGTVVNG